MLEEEYWFLITYQVIYLRVLVVTLFAAIYGRFSDVLIGQWSGIEIETDIYSDFAKGSVGVRALATIDIALRHGESFSLVKDAIAA